MTHQIIEVPDISVVKTVNGENQLLSLRDQKLVKDGALQHIGPGSGVMYSGDMYVLEELPIVKMITTGNNLSVSVFKSSDVRVDWGDGVVEVNVFSHSYTDEIQEHVIKFYGATDALTYFSCNSSQLTMLDVSRNVALAFVLCTNNQLTVLDVSQNLALKLLACFTNRLTTLDVSKNILLESLSCGDNQLTTLDVSQNTVLRSLACFSNYLTALDISSNTSLGRLECQMNPFMNDTDKLLYVANSLMDLNGKDKGMIWVDSAVTAIIQDICDAKNWSVHGT